MTQPRVDRADLFIGQPYMGMRAHRPGLGGRVSVEMVPVYYQVKGSGFSPFKRCRSIYFLGNTDYDVVFSWTQNAYVDDNHITLRRDVERSKKMPCTIIRRVVCVHPDGVGFSEINIGLPATLNKHQL